MTKSTSNLRTGICLQNDIDKSNNPIQSLSQYMSHDTGYANKFDFELKIKNYKLACQIAKKRIANIRIKINKFYSFSPKKLKYKCRVVSK